MRKNKKQKIKLSIASVVTQTALELLEHFIEENRKLKEEIEKIKEELLTKLD